MKVSLNKIRFLNQHYNSAGDPAPDGIDELVEKIGAQLGAVEDVEDLGAKYKGVVIAKVVSCEDHPNADRLHVCKIDDGGVAQGVERDENGYVQVVCGAPNVRAGLLVAWLPPASTVPETYHHEAPFVLEARELRGVISNGMLASSKELALGDSHDGILEIDVDAKPGASFAEVYRLDDHIIDIENKMFTHRPDCFGLLGIARELEGIQHRPYKSPEWYQLHPEFPGVEAEELSLQIHNEVPAIVPRFTAITMRDVKVGPSPLWLQTTLLSLGSRPINNIVDYTNYFMLETGQPLHAYDYDKVATGKLGARMAHDGEKLNLLNGKQASLTDKDVVITDGEKPIGLGGVMGGADTEVDEHTTNIILECANFDMYAIRRTSMRHGLFTDAVTRFNKGQSPLQNLAVLAKIVDEIRQYANGKVASRAVDDNHVSPETMDRGSVHAPVNVSAAFINARLGLELSSDEMKVLLENVEFSVSVDDNSMIITAPFWRTDIEIPEDIVEEVGRLYGYDRLPLVLPTRSTEPALKNPLVELKRTVRQVLARAGANEVLTYSFVHGDLLNKVGQSTDDSFQLTNALSPDLQYYRQTVLPSLLDKVHANIKSGYDEFALFEIGKGHNLQHADDDDGLPSEFELLDFVYAANDKSARPGAAYYQARNYLGYLMTQLGIELEFRVIGQEIDVPVVKPFDHTRSAFVFIRGTEHVLGVVGELKSSVRKALKLPTHTAAFSLGLKDILSYMPGTSTNYKPLSRYPGMSQDICLRVQGTTHYGVVQTIFENVLKQTAYEWRLAPIYVYATQDQPDYKQVTIRVHLNNALATLTAAEAQTVVKSIVAAAKSELGAEQV